MRDQLAVMLIMTLLPASVAAQENADVLAKQLSNPVAALISVPVQFNPDFGFGEKDGWRLTTNVQPVIPSAITEDWNLITRVIMPVIYQDDVFPGSSEFGLGDFTPTFFFSPRATGSGGWIWGIGPIFLLPTASDDHLGAGKWGLGLSPLALKQAAGGLTYGALVNHIESVAGDDDRRDVSNTFIQPFFAKQFPGAKTLTFNLESSYDWEGEQWTVPLNVSYSKVTKMGGQMLSLAGGARAYLEKPEGGPDWGLRFVVTFLFPK